MSNSLDKNREQVRPINFWSCTRNILGKLEMKEELGKLLEMKEELGKLLKMKEELGKLLEMKEELGKLGKHCFCGYC